MELVIVLTSSTENGRLRLLTNASIRVREWSIFMGIRGRNISYGAANFLARHFIRGGELFHTFSYGVANFLDGHFMRSLNVLT